MLAAYRLHEVGIFPSQVFTFGAPRVGDFKFANAYHPLLHRFENAGDPVPGLPVTGEYHAVGKGIYLSHDNRAYREDGSWSDGLVKITNTLIAASCCF